MYDLVAIWAATSTGIAITFSWMWYRRHELETLAQCVYDAAKDYNINEDEFQAIVDKLGKVLYKK